MNQGTGRSIPEAGILEWCINRSGSKVQRGVQIAMVMGAIYQIWQQRNRCRVEKVLQRPANVANLLLEDMRIRIRERDKRMMKIDDIEWLERKNLM